MSPRGASFLIAVVLIACGAVAAVAIGVAWPVALIGAAVAAGAALRVAARRPRTPAPAAPKEPSE